MTDAGQNATPPREPVWFFEHWVAWTLLTGMASAALAGWIVNPPRPAPGWALRQDLVYRIEFAGILLIVGYVALMALRLGWHNQTFSKITVGPATAEAPAEQAAADELTRLRADIQALTDTTSETLEGLNGRVEALEAEHADRDPEVS